MAFDLSLLSDGTALPDFGLGTPTDYNTPPSTEASGWETWNKAVQTGLTTYKQVVSVVNPQYGAPIAQPVTIPAPDSPAGRDSVDPASGEPTWAQKMSAKLGVGVAVVWALAFALIALLGVAAYKLFK